VTDLPTTSTSTDPIGPENFRDRSETIGYERERAVVTFL